MQKVTIIGAHGLGDCLMAIQCAHFLKYQRGITPRLLISTRDEVFQPLKHTYKDIFELEQIPESYSQDNLLLKETSIWNKFADGSDETYYVLPDLLFNNEHTFDFQKYGTNPQHIRSIKTLLDKAAPTKSIYLGLMTSTPNYDYAFPMRLALQIAQALPNNQVIFPMISNWAGKDLKGYAYPQEVPQNLTIQVNPKFEDSIDDLSRAGYFVGTDNGPSHLAYHLGMPRLILDPQYHRLPWVARWREDYLESISIDTEADDIAKLVKANIEVPQSCLIPRAFALLHSYSNWESLLLLKKS